MQNNTEQHGMDYENNEVKKISVLYLQRPMVCGIIRLFGKEIFRLEENLWNVYANF